MSHRLLTAHVFDRVVSLFLTYSFVIALCAQFSTVSRARETSLPQAQASPAIKPGELLVKFRSSVSPQLRDALIASIGARRRSPLRGQSNLEKLELNGTDPFLVALQLRQHPAIEFAEPNFVINQAEIVPDDPEFSQQWGMRNTGQNGGQYGSDINVANAWERTTGGTSTVIAVIDSGIDFTHADLATNQWTNLTPSTAGDVHGWDYITESPQILDEQGHGTAIAGIIAAAGNNGIGTSGVMWRANLMSLRVLDNTGTGDVADAVEAIDYAVSHGAQVINISWGTTGESTALREAIARAIQHNVVVVCSAGNGGANLAQSPYYPASFGLPDLIVVSATDNFDQLASWSNWGANVKLAAPGVNILSTKMGGGYWNATGTSAAAPLVSGVAGLMKSMKPQASSHAVNLALQQSARQVASLAGKVKSGGVVNAAVALQVLSTITDDHGPSPLPLPTPSVPGGTSTPPASTTGAPGSNLPNLDQIRDATNTEPQARVPIQSNLMCADCDPQGGGGGGTYYPTGDPNFSGARNLPGNQTGQTAVDLGSRNFNWGVPVVSLPGRAGMDLNLALVYNSLVWTKDGSYIKYNADLGSPAPGFRLGLPILQQRFYNSQTGGYSYNLVGSSGGRTELRQVGSTNFYEAADGSYMQLETSNPNALLVRTADGTQLTFVPVTVNSEFRCTQIRDRNGNLISATYNTSNGHLLTVTDTLGRVVNFNYDGNSNLQSISQTWASGAHNWATFSYGEVYVGPQFGGGLLVNGPNGNYVTVLTQVSLHDGTYFTFGYNAAFGQVNRINHYAADGHLLAYTAYNVDSSAGQTDCPRFTQRKDWAENWNNGAEAITNYSVDPGGAWSQQTAPDQTIYKEFYATSGWQTGLTTSTEVWSNSVKRKWTTTSWTQDDTNVSYKKNPRPTETNVYDPDNNRRRATISYTSFSLPSGVSCSLPADVYEYHGDATTVLRRTHTDYLTDSNYINSSRRLIGLPRFQFLYDGANNLLSKVEYQYDWAYEHLQALPATATQHEANFSSTSFLLGRGNLTLVLRYDVTDPTNVNKATQHKWGYNTTGSLIFDRDHPWHQANIGYADAFSDNVNRNTFAYPTAFSDEDNFQSLSKYNFDFGAVTWAQAPSPNAGQTAPTQTFIYDSATRLERVTNGVNGAYKRFVYPTSRAWVESFTTLQNGAGEFNYAEILDGAGRVRAVAGDAPNSVGGYFGQYFTYDAMGRLTQTSNPTEVASSWTPAGDDAAAGWLWTLQTYDWKGRPLRTTNPDGSYRENTYGGCGCAGGEVVTARDETARRRRMTMDVVGRLAKVEELNWDQSVYATTNYTYNVRDQILTINQAGQTRTFDYDGHGRLWHKTTPEQGQTTYSYFADDLVQTVTDARGAKMTFSYNARHLVTGINYDVSQAPGVAATANVSYGYDAAGNRTSMTDGLGSVSYVYDQLSRMTSETRTFTGVGNFTLSYQYNLAGELTKITNPWNAEVSYNYDKSGRAISVGGANYYSVTSYVNNIAYRAFGAPKQLSYANGRALSLSYNNRLQISRWDLPQVGGGGTATTALGYAYQYESSGNSGRVQFADSLYDSTLDRSWTYDHVGRLVQAYTGKEANGIWGAPDGPYAQSFGYDVWGNRTHREGWGGSYGSYTNDNPTFTNNKQNGLGYDAAGNYTSGGATYDAMGQAVSITGGANSYFDGDRLRGKRVEGGVTTYYLRSSVLGGKIVADITSTGGWERGYVYLGEQLLAIQYAGVTWAHQEPFTKGQRFTNASGAMTTNVIEVDPFGGETSRSANSAFQPQRFTSYVRDVDGGDDAMHRRYGNYYARFSQPDPYDGSYSLTDPQSLNRYSYVQSDPVNFVDPSGLMATICGYVSGDPGGWACIELWDWYKWSGFEPKQGGTSQPQNPSQYDRLPGSDMTACLVMADIAEQEANTALYRGSDAAAVLEIFDGEFSRLYHGGPIHGYNDAERWRHGQGRPKSMEYYASNGSGFKPQFRDTGNEGFPIGGYGAEQTHHFSFYLSLGINTRITNTNAAIYAYGYSRDNTGDQRLSASAYNYGLQLRNRPEELRKIGDWIRRNICSSGGHGLYYRKRGGAN